jgi:hypothetical protein
MSKSGVIAAYDRLSQAMKDDPEYAWAWHCNVAMASVDEGLNHLAANRAAARFMHLAFGVDTTKHREFKRFQIEAAATKPSCPCPGAGEEHY